MRLRLTMIFLLLAWLVMPSLGQETEPVCSLTEEQTQKSIDAFAKLVPLFQHPRCINCHGEVNPFDESDSNHEGGSFPDRDNAPDCSTSGCHSKFPSWFTPPASMFFVGKDAEQLCELMHTSFDKATGNLSFMEHMTHDEPPFIEVALVGDRAMTPQDLAPDKADPPPGWDHAKVTQLSQAWVDSTGGRFHGNASCGCKKQEYVFRLSWKQTLNINFGVINGQSVKTTESPNGQGVDIPLTAKEPKVFTGQGRLTIRGRGQYETAVGGCSSQGELAFDVKVTARIEEGKEESRGQDDKMHVTFECKKVQHDFSGACPQVGGSSSGSDNCQADGVKLDFNPPTVGKSQSQEFPSPVPNSQTMMTGTLLKKQ